MHDIEKAFPEKMSEAIKDKNMDKINELAENANLDELQKYLKENPCIDNIFGIIDSNNLKELEKYLEKYPLSIFDLDENRKSPLFVAISKGFENIVEILIKNKANVNGTCDDQVLLHFAVKKGNYNIVKLLVINGANINDISPDDYETPLHIAVENLNYNIAKFLIENGANVRYESLVRGKFQTPIELIVCKYREEVSNLSADNKISEKKKNGLLNLFKLLSSYAGNEVYELADFPDWPTEYIKIFKVYSLLESLVHDIGEIEDETLELLNDANIQELVAPQLLVMCGGVKDNLQNLPEDTPRMLKNAVNDCLEISEKNEETFYDMLDNHFARIHYKLDRKNFSALNYSDLEFATSSNFYIDVKKIQKRLNYYNQNPKYIPKNYLLYLIDPNNQKEVKHLILDHYDIFKEIFEEIQNSKIILEADIADNLKKFLNFEKIISSKDVENNQVMKQLEKENAELRSQLDALLNANKEPEVKEGKQEEPIKKFQDKVNKRPHNNNDRDDKFKKSSTGRQ